MKKFTDMKSEELYKFTENYINEKLKQNSDEVRYSYFEVAVKMGADEDDIDRFLVCSRIILECLNFKVYFTGAKFEYKNAKRTVESNELMIAVKDEEQY